MSAAPPAQVESAVGENSPADKVDNEARFEKLDAFGDSLGKKRSEAIKGRQQSGIETQWLEDEEHYQGIDDLNRNEHSNAWRTKPPGQYQAQAQSQVRSTVFVNITQPYVNAAAARIADMLLPSDDKNFAILPTPIPDLFALAEGNIPPQIMAVASQATDKETVQKVIGDATASAKKMVDEVRVKAKKAERRIEDWMVECQYHAEVRQVIEDSARIGTGVLKGPVPIKKRRIALNAGALVIEDKIQPGSKRVDPWNLFPDPSCGEIIHNGSFVWERDNLSPRQLSDLKGTTGYIDEQIDKCLEEGPQKAVAEYKREPDGKLDGEEGKRFEVWYFTGYADKDDMLAAGCECDENDTKRIPALVTMVNNHVIKAVLNPLDSGDFPYDVFPWARKSGMPWGNGVGRLGRTPQQIVVASARNLMDNAGLSAGVQIVLDDRAISPSDGQWSLTPRKIWFKGPDGDMDDVKKAMAFFEIPSRQKELLEIVQFGMKMMEDVTGLPMLLQGQQGKAPDTVGGMTLLNNNASAVLRRLARLFDDFITEPHVRRYYTWLLQYGEDDEKGDFSIDARGSSALLERDLQSQELPEIMKASLNPVFGADPKKAFGELLKSRHFDPKTFQYDDEEWKKIVAGMSQKPPDPRIAVAQLSEQGKQAQREFEAAENEKDRQMKLAIEMIDERLTSAELTSLERQTLDKIRAELASTSMKLATQKELSAASMAVDIHKHRTQPPKVIAPPTEPAGRARKGQAFQA